MQIMRNAFLNNLHCFSVLFPALFVALFGNAMSAQPIIATSEGSSSFAVAKDGRLYGWGADTFGQLGQNRFLSSAAPVPTTGGYKLLSIGNSYVAAVKTDGTLWAWGTNNFGQLGDGSIQGTSTPKLIGSGYRSVTATTALTYALKLDGSLWAWGQGNVGLGQISNTSRSPVQIGAGYQAVASSGSHTLGLKTDGTLVAWGLNQYGQLGYVSSDVCNPGPNASNCSFTARAIGTGYTAIAAGGRGSSYALRADGTMWAWGNNDTGQLRDGTYTNRAVPLQIASNIIQIGAGNNHAVALRGDGAWLHWGDSFDGFPANRKLTPTEFGTGFVHIAAGSGGTVAIKADGSVWGMGLNDFGQFGPEPRTISSPRQFATGAVSIAIGGDNAGYVDAGGTLWLLGSNGSGQLAVGTPVNKTSPVLIGEGFATVATGGNGGTVLAVKTDGTLWAWGSNSNSRLGNGTGIDSPKPIQIGTDADYRIVAVGGIYAMAIKRNGDLFAWGSNGYGGTGLGDALQLAQLPKFVDQGFATVSLGSLHTLALKSNGELYSFGANANGQLGVATQENCRVGQALVPCSKTRRLVGADFVSIAAGTLHSAAIKSDGSLWTWGDNSAGQLGVSTSETCALGANNPGNGAVGSPCATTPQLVGTGFVQVTAGLQHTLAIKTDGSLWAWGTNFWGYLGDGSRTNVIARPKRVGAGYTQVVAGGYQSFGTRANGTLWAWGENRQGALGDSTLADRPSPVLVRNVGGAGLREANDWFLDLDPTVGKGNLDAETPVFLVNTEGSGTNVRANINFQRGDVGRLSNIYIFALAPASMVKGAGLVSDIPPDDPAARIQLQATRAPISAGDPKMQSDAKAQSDGPLGCVLAQLNAQGQLTASSATNLQAFISGVLTAGGTAVNVLNNISAAAIQGSTFFIGYGTSGTTMINGGTNRSVATVPGSVSCQPQAPQTGWWWNPVEGGRGYSVEVRGTNLFWGGFLYDQAGRANWLVAPGPVTLDGALFQGTLYSVDNGQTLSGAYKPPSPVKSEGLITLSFATATSGTMIWPSGTIPIERLPFVPDGLSTPPQPFQPETGWWWNASESGRGFFIEWQAGVANVVGYMYADDGKPVWYLSVYPTPDPKVFSGNWWLYGNGQATGGPYKPTTRLTDNFAPLSIRFTDSKNGVMTLPGGKQLAITRFLF